MAAEKLKAQEAALEEEKVDIENIIFVKLTHDDPHDAKEVREEE